MTMWSSWGESAKASLSQALEKTETALSKTGDAISKAASSANQKVSAETQSEPSSTATGRYEQEEAADPPAVLKNLQAGWSSMITSTKHGLEKAEHAMKIQQEKLSTKLEQAKMMAHQRDIKLPLDKPALRDAQLVYITDRILTMAHPCLDSDVDPSLTGPRKMAAVAHLLEKRHSSKYMVWNLSEVDYDTSLFQNQVLVYSFPGSPAPPLGLWLKILTSIEAWLKADPSHVAVVHCLTGQGRTSLVVASFLAWMAQANMTSVNQALEYVALCKRYSMEDLTIPSQRRYASYLGNMLDNVRPTVPPLVLKRVILSSAPPMIVGPPVEGDNEDSKEARMGCAPYVQVFCRGELLKTAATFLPETEGSKKTTAVPFIRSKDSGNLTFNLDQVVRGDILLRCRHLTAHNRQRESLFRAAMHTGYVSSQRVLRLTKAQLDGAHTDDRIPADFFVDLILEPAENEDVEPTPSEATKPESTSKPNNKVTASPEDCMLDRDSRFWDVIAERKNKEEKSSQEEPEDALWGPTVGRLRNVGGGGDEASNAPFSIDGSLLLDSSGASTPVEKPKPTQPDSLMQALMGVLDDEAKGPTEDTTEEVVFFDDPDAALPEVAVVAETATAETEETPTDSTGGEAAVAEKKQTPPSTTSLSDDMDALLNDTSEVDMDALLSSDVDDLLNLDVDDADLDDLDSFLKS